MGLETTIEKLDKYFGRLEKGKAEKIKPSHVDKAIAKLQAKEAALLAEIEETTKSSKAQRLEGKLATVREQLDRAHWLKGKISDLP